MANIIFTSNCNLHCSYCFANKIKSNNLNINRQELNRILNWLSRSYYYNPHPIGIIGGEPTLHPNFINYLKIIEQFCNEYNTFCTIYTNGIENYYLNFLDLNTTILININDTNYNNKLFKTLDLLKESNVLYEDNDYEIKKVTLGCNLYPREQEYKFFWDIIDKYEINKVRLAVTSPSFEYKKDIDSYYQMMLPIYEKFCLQAEKRQISLIPDCAQIPQKYLKDTYIPDIFDYPILEQCVPVIDIDKNLQAFRCLGSNKKVNCLDFSDYDTLLDYFIQQDKENNYTGCIAFYE